MSQKKNILFIRQYTNKSKFITNDLEILKKKYNCKECVVYTKKNLYFIIALIKQFTYLTFNIFNYNLVFIWFADYHSLIPVFFFKLFNKKSIICAGGYEATYIPEINMGVYSGETIRKRFRRFSVKYSLKNCNLILPVDDSLIQNVNTYIYSDNNDKGPLKDGIKQFIPGIRTEMKTLDLGFDKEIFKAQNNLDKEKTVVSAGFILNDFEFKRKGFDLLIEAGKILKDVKFTLIGFSKEYLSKTKLQNFDNIVFLEILSYNRLIEEYSKGKVFAQLSLFEGFPSTLCEAMLCECIPVGSNVNGIPRAVNDAGIVVYKKEINEIVQALQKAINTPTEFGKKARQHIIDNFPLEKRESGLINIIDGFLN